METNTNYIVYEKITSLRHCELWENFKCLIKTPKEREKQKKSEGEMEKIFSQLNKNYNPTDPRRMKVAEKKMKVEYYCFRRLLLSYDVVYGYLIENYGNLIL